MTGRVHVAIMRKGWGLTKKILTGEKTIESRWYMNRYRPWGAIAAGDVVYFKDSGEPVKIRAVVEKVLQFDSLTPRKVRAILQEYGEADGLGVEKEELEKWWRRFKDKRYCLLIFLEGVEEVEPFEIDKTGFGAMAAWLTVNELAEVKRG